ncbi:spectrin beta chain-like isoform X4 [Tubulanus polymorphus]|uniref:spectrin beta chain-like isoform X4 n=1 Tax=Tubulanus polymorphus TaxID=672921 RepID=UPI003DA1D821
MTEIDTRWDGNAEDWEGGDNSSKLFERSRIKALADERETVQKKTFTKWVNSHLARVNCKINDLYVDLRDGRMLMRLLEILSGERLPKPTKGKMRIHCLENVEKSLDFLREMRVQMENMGCHDIVDGNSRLTLGLIWTIILRFQIQDITFEESDNSETKQAKDALLLWCQMKTAGYANVNVRNFTTSWKDGLAFNALIHKHRPDLIPYEKLTKVNPLYNLETSFSTAEDKLGLTQLLDPEDVNVEHPDEKSIITYVVTYYHYFSKMKAESVHSKRIGKVVGHAVENEHMMEEYESLTSDLLEWIQQTISTLNDRTFSNSLQGVQQQLAQFNSYRTVEKPPKFVEKGNLEVLLFTLQSKMRANNQKPYYPKEGKLISDINKAWERLEKAEHERELALREELIRQEKLEQLAARFDRKAGMRETWLSENQRLVAQDNFGYDLAAVEAATKKHEAIETDINAYEERVQAVIAVAEELKQENYHDFERIDARKENVLRLWTYLLELLRARRLRLELSLSLQKIFQEMLYILDWIDEIKSRLLSEDYGKHLMGVEDLLQKHSLLEADINVVGDRVKAVNGSAEKYVTGDLPEEAGDYRPCDTQIVTDRMSHLSAAYEELLQLAADRRSRLEDSRKMWQFYWDMADEEGWIKEKEQLMSSPDLGHDLTTVHLLINKHKGMEDELQARHSHLQGVIKVGEDLIEAGNFAADKIKIRIDEINQQWENLIELAAYRKKRLLEALDFYQFFADADDVDTWMLDTLRIVSSEDVGHDESSVQSLLKKHKSLLSMFEPSFDVTDQLENYRTVIDALREQASNLGEQDKDSQEVQGRLASIERRYNELLELAKLRKQRLLDALSLYRLYNDADTVEVWISEKEKLLATMVPGDDIEELEIIRHRFDGFEHEMQVNASKVENVNQIARQLLQVEHPNADDILARQQQLNDRWAHLQSIVEDKRKSLGTAYGIKTFHIEITETVTWIREKTKLVESTDELGNDLASVMVLQRKLSGMEKDLEAIEAKVDSLNAEADRLCDEKPEEAAAIREQVTRITEVWTELKDQLKERDEKLNESSELQKFLQNLDHFQAWLSRTQTAIASEDIPQDLVQAEQLLNEHQQIKEEIDGYAPEYEKMKDYGNKVTEGQSDAQYMFLSQRLQALDDGWNELHQMWDNQQNLLTQGMNLQVFLRDSIQCEVQLSKQENFLAKDDVPSTQVGRDKQGSLEQAENMIKEHEAFITTMDANDEKVNGVLQFAQRLIDENHFSGDKIHTKAQNIEERRNGNRQRAYEHLERLKDSLMLQQFMQDCDDIEEWLQDKKIAAEDETYRDAKNIHSKYMRHQAFESEITANKDRLNKCEQDGDELVRQKPEWNERIEERLNQLKTQWDELEDTTKDKGARLFDANKHVLYEQNIDDIDGWMKELETQVIPEEASENLAGVNILIKKQENQEQEMVIKQQQVETLEAEQTCLLDLDPHKREEIEMRKKAIEERFQRINAPLIERRNQLEQKKRIHQFLRDIEDEKLWIDEKMQLATSTNYGNSLLSVHMLLKKNKSLQSEIMNHEPRIHSVCDDGRLMISDGHPLSEEFQQKIDELLELWDDLLKAVEARKERLQQSEVAQQFYYDASEAEAWMSEQELYMMGEDRAKDENGANNMMKKHQNLEKTIEDYAETIRQLSDNSRELIDQEHPESETIATRQAQVDKLYAGLKDLMQERRSRLDEVLKLYTMNREIEDLLQWIAEREVVAGSHELGQDFEHVTMLLDRFKEFARDTQNIGSERVAEANDLCDQLINAGHSDAATIAEWKDGLNEAWTDLLELIETRTQALQASWELHKFFHDCKDTLERIYEKQNTIPEDLGRDAKTVAALQRKHANFEHDLVTLGAQVQTVQEDASKLIAGYAGDKAREIREREAEVVNAWRNLQMMCEYRKNKLADTNDLFRFFNMVRDLRLWMKDIITQMNTQEKPRDVSGVELLMNNHQSLKAEVDAREENFAICVNLGKDLLARKHYRQEEVREKLIQLTTERCTMMDQWEDRWEYLQLILEVYQFARDAYIAECWLIAQEPYLQNTDLGETLAEVEKLIKKHEAFEKAAATQEERFAALERLTTFELKERIRRRREKYASLGYDTGTSLSPQEGSFHEDDTINFELKERQKRQEEEYRRQHPEIDHGVSPRELRLQKMIEEFLPPPEKEPEPEIVHEPERGAGEPLVNGESEEPSRAPRPVEKAQVSPTQEAAKPKKRSKSPFGSWSRKGRPKSHEDAPSVIEPVSGSPGDVEFHHEGILVRKHEWESTTKKASSRHWDKLYSVLNQSEFSFYHNQKQAKADPSARFHHEPAIDLAGSSVAVATDYHKRPHVLRLKLNNGGEYLLQCKDDDEMNVWLTKINTCIGEDGGSPSRAQTLPAKTDSPTRGEPKRRSFFTLGKKK